MSLFLLSDIDNFHLVRGIKSDEVALSAMRTVKHLDERGEIEPWIQGILFDSNHTPHGPSEIVDILTHKMSVRGRSGTSAFILKGRSFPTVRPKDVAHQIARLHRLKDLKFAIFASVGNVLDDVKEHFLNTADQLGVGYAFLDSHDLARLFIAYGYICPRDGEKIVGGRCACGFSPTNRTSNILQQAALKELEVAHRLGETSGLVVLPTGAGKTRLAVVDIKRSNPKLAIYVAHSHEILEKAEEEFLSEFPRGEVRRFSERPTTGEVKRINCLTIQALSRNLQAFEGSQVDYLVVDEFHHAAAPSYRQMMQALKPSFLLGLTATPFRADQKDVLQLCRGNVIANFDLRQGIEHGILCPYHYYGCFDDVDYSNIRHNGVRYDISDLERALIVPERDAAIVEKWEEKGAIESTIAFCCSHSHAERVASSFRLKGYAAEVYLASTSQVVRSTLRDRFRLGGIRVLCVVDVLNEGVDFPFVGCLLFLRPTESKRVFLQQFGRGLRRFVGKEYCVVIDFIGNFRNAYRIVSHLDLEPSDVNEEDVQQRLNSVSKDIYDLPLGCTVEFDERVITIFGDQSLSPRFATGSNIARILEYQYWKLEQRVGRLPTRADVNRSCILGTNFYNDVFGSWAKFQKQYAGKNRQRPWN